MTSDRSIRELFDEAGLTADERAAMEVALGKRGCCGIVTTPLGGGVRHVSACHQPVCEVVDGQAFCIEHGREHRYQMQSIERLMTSDPIRTAEDYQQAGLEMLRMAATMRGDEHFDHHLIEFRNDGWTIQHTLTERVDGSLFDCPFALWPYGDLGYRGRFVLLTDEDGDMTIGARVRHDQ